MRIRILGWAMGGVCLLALGGIHSRRPRPAEKTHARTMSSKVLLPGPGDRSHSSKTVSARATPPSQEDRSLEIPDRDGLERIATAKARKLWGNGVILYEGHPYLGPGRRVASYVFVFAFQPGVPNREDLFARLREKRDLLRWERHFGGVEVGATGDAPPIVAFWTGLPLEYSAKSRGEERLRARFGDRRFELQARFGSALFPILEFTDGAGRFYYDGHDGKAMARLRMEKREGRMGAAAREERARRIREQWNRHAEGGMRCD